MPFLGVALLEEAVAVSSHAADAHPAVAMDPGRRNARLLMTSPLPRHGITGSGAPHTTPAEFDGLPARHRRDRRGLRCLGSVPTSMTPTKVCNAVDTARSDTAAFARHAPLSPCTIDIAEGSTETFGPGTVNRPVMVNTDACDAPPEASRERR